MITQFGRMTAHSSEPRRAGGCASVVLSEIGRGASIIGARQASIKLVLEGEELYRIDGRDVRLTPGQLLFVDAGSDCAVTFGGRAVGMCLRFPEEQMRQWPEADDPLLGRSVLQCASATPFGRILVHHATRLAADPAVGEQIAPQIMRDAAQRLAEPIGERALVLSRISAARPAKRRELFQRLERVRSFFHEHVDRALTLAEAAEVAALSRFHLARYFRAAYGESPMAYHRRLRLDHAADLIDRSDAPLALIAERAGYSDAVALCHAFQRQFGRSPRSR
jgi:AraC family transcriptional regulator